jgi:CxxC motif-containing protein (DUF1111 family)
MGSLRRLVPMHAVLSTRGGRILVLVAAVLLFVYPALAQNQTASSLLATDPGVRGGAAGAGNPFSTLSQAELAFFNAGLDEFIQVDSVKGTIAGTGAGLGPRFNLDSCGGCHAQPVTGGTSPPLNPQVAVATKEGAQNIVPFFITPDGPVREARFKFNRDGSRDGGVHDLFTITGRSDATGCTIAQPDFLTPAHHNNLIFRIPTPVLGAGLIENIPDEVILKNKNDQLAQKRKLGIDGRENRSGNDGSITRFGWKAQNKSLLMFSGEAYNVEMGVTSELFPQERDETPGCVFNPLPEDVTNFNPIAVSTAVPSDVEKFTFFMRLLAPPTPAPDNPSIVSGRQLFEQVGCTLCHTPALSTGPTAIAALSNQTVNLFSDLLLHQMGRGLADDIVQGNAGPDEFRTAPLWGLGQRLFFLHDGRTPDLREAIRQHDSLRSEAKAVIRNFKALTETQKQDLLDFLRSL